MIDAARRVQYVKENQGITSKQTFYERLPKVELHRHLEGSLRIKTIAEVARLYGITVPTMPVTAQLRPLVQVQPEDAYTYRNFLSKFQHLRQFYRSPEIIQRVVREAIEDAARDNIRYLELRVSPMALARAEGFSFNEVLDWVCASARQAAVNNHIQTRLIITINRHESIEITSQFVDLALARLDCGIVGLDLAGNEAEFVADPFLPLFKKAHEGGLKLSIHAGEWAGAENVLQAIAELDADRIAHGVRVIEDAEVVSLAKRENIPFEVCLTSNHQSGVVTTLSKHPLQRMLAAGLNVNLGTDDPSISQITLSGEYQVACEVLGISRPRLVELILNGARAAFLPEIEKAALVKALEVETKAVLDEFTNR